MCCFFFFNDTATTEIYTLSLHDALPISSKVIEHQGVYSESKCCCTTVPMPAVDVGEGHTHRSEEHTSELQSQSNLVCRLLLEKKKHSSYHHIPRHYAHSITSRPPEACVP